VNDVNKYENYVRFMSDKATIFEGNKNIKCSVYFIDTNFQFIKLQKLISMSLLSVLLVIIIVGVLLWVVNTYIPMDHKIKNILNIVVVIIVIIWLLKVFGLFSYLMNIHV